MLICINKKEKNILVSFYPKIQNSSHKIHINIWSTSGMLLMLDLIHVISKSVWLLIYFHSFLLWSLFVTVTPRNLFLKGEKNIVDFTPFFGLEGFWYLLWSIQDSALIANIFLFIVDREFTNQTFRWEKNWSIYIKLDDDYV